jgi:hypothetical protein
MSTPRIGRLDKAAKQLHVAAGRMASSTVALSWPQG